jgi:AcrR family transcriptional regulator
MVLKEVDGEVGMFYHYFKSKHELFDEVVQYYMDKYVENYRIIAEDVNKSFIDQLGDMAELLKKASTEYTLLMKEQNMHWTVQHALHERTLKSLEPYMTLILKKGIEDGIAHNVLELDIDTLSSCIIHGIDGILHVHDATEITNEKIRQTEEDVYKYLKHMINISI